MQAHIKMVLLYWKECWIFWSDCNLEKKIISADPYDWMVGKVWKSGRKTGFSSLITDLIRRWIMHTPAGQGGAKLPSNLQIEFFSSYHPLIQKIFPHTTLPKRRSATIRPPESTAGCMLIILSRNPSPVSMAPTPTTQCHRREPSIRQMTVFSSRRPSFQRVIYPWLCPLAITQQSQIWSDWPNKHYSKRPWRCQPR